MRPPSNGDLKGKFIMDRNLGARDTKWASDHKGILTYQFGRKDPFAGGGDFSAVTTAYIGRGELGESDIWTISGVSGEATDGISISTAVNSPMIFYTRVFSNGYGNWCSAVNSESISWHDYDVDVESDGKSIFDPSPLGWKVPPHGTWGAVGEKNAFSLETMTDWIYIADSDNPGRSYPKENSFAYYPAHGIRDGSSPANGGNTIWVHMWSSTPSSVLNSHFFSPSYSAVSHSTFGRARGMAIRCVQHDE